MPPGAGGKYIAVPPPADEQFRSAQAYADQVQVARQHVRDTFASGLPLVVRSSETTAESRLKTEVSKSAI